MEKTCFFFITKKNKTNTCIFYEILCLKLDSRKCCKLFQSLNAIGILGYTYVMFCFKYICLHVYLSYIQTICCTLLQYYSLLIASKWMLLFPYHTFL